jgi:hypothetical protein
VEYLDVVDKRGIADLQRIFQCSRKDAEDVVLLARRAVASGDRYQVMTPPKGSLATSRKVHPGHRIGHAFDDAEVRELAAGIDPPGLRGKTADERYALQVEAQDRLRRERNIRNGYHDEDPAWLERQRAWLVAWHTLNEGQHERLLEERP